MPIILAGTGAGISLRIRLPGATSFTDYADFLFDAGTGGASGSGGSSMSIMSLSWELNTPPQLTFALTTNPFNISEFTAPTHGCEIHVDSVIYPHLFTGFLSSDPAPKAQGGQDSAMQAPLVSWIYTAIGEEILLNYHRIGILPPWTNKTDGEILSELIQFLVPGRFDTTGIVGFGDVNSVVKVSPDQTFSDFAQTFLKRKSAKLWFERGKVFLDRIDDALYVVEDETTDELYNPHDFTITPIQSTVRNDVTGIGDPEPKAYAREYHVSEGIETHYPLKLPLWGTEGKPIVDDNFDGALDPNVWTLADPSGAIVEFNGSLNITGGLGLDVTKLLLNQGIEIRNKRRVNSGEFTFTGPNDGLAGGLYSSQTLTLPNCLLGYQLSGATTMQAVVDGAAVGLTLDAAPNKTYTLHLFIDAGVDVANLQPWYSTRSAWGGGSKSAPILVTFRVEENDTLTARAPVFYQLYQATLIGILPDFVWIGELSVNTMNAIVNGFYITEPIQGTLLETLIPETSPPSLWDPIPLQKALGFVGDTDADATITVTTEGAALDFFIETRPAVQTKIELWYRSSGPIVVRVIDSVSIADEASRYGDDGVRATVLFGFGDASGEGSDAPEPVNDDDMTAMLQAFLADTVLQKWQGDWIALSPQYDFSAVKPIPGRFLRLNVPSLLAPPVTGFDVLINRIQIDVVAVDDFGNETLQFEFSFGSLATRNLERILQAIGRRVLPDDVVTLRQVQNVPAIDTTLIATAYLKDVPDLALTGYVAAIWCPPDPAFTIGSFELSTAIDTSGYQIEVRWSDASWGPGDGNNLIGRFGGSPFNIDRRSRDQWCFAKLTDGAKVSRNPAFVRVNYPLVPPPPPGYEADVTSPSPRITLLLPDPLLVTPVGGGGLLDVFGVEIRDDDDLTVLYHYQAASLGGRGDDPALTYVWPNPAGVPTKTLFAYFHNLLNEYSCPLQIDLTLLVPPLSTSGDCIVPNFVAGASPTENSQAIQDALDRAFANVSSGAGPTTVCINGCIPIGPLRLDGNGGNQYGAAGVCLTMDSGVTLQLNGTLIMIPGTMAATGTSSMMPAFVAIENRNAYTPDVRDHGIKITGVGTIFCNGQEGGKIPWDAGTPSAWMIGVRFRQCDDSAIEDISILNALGSAVFWGESEKFTIQDANISNTLLANFHITANVDISNYGAIALDMPRQATIVHNKLFNNEGEGIVLVRPLNSIIGHNELIRQGYNGIIVWGDTTLDETGPDVLFESNTQIVGNVIQYGYTPITGDTPGPCATAGISGYSGLVQGPQASDYGFYTGFGRPIANGISVQASFKLKSLSIVANTIEGNWGSGVYVESMEGLLVESNIIRNNAGFGLNFFGGATDIQVAHNYLTGNALGNWVDTTGAVTFLDNM